jgi:hypothetical protein
MKIKLTFNDENGQNSTVSIISLIKFYRAITGEGLRASKEAIDDMREKGLKTITVTTLANYDAGVVSRYAITCGLNVSIGKCSKGIQFESEGTISLLSSGEVKFNLTNGPDHSLQTVVARKQAGRVLDTFLQTSSVTQRKRKGVHRKGPRKTA